MPAIPLLSLDRVNRDYDDGRITALHDIDLAIGAGESVAIVGASGSGKTTLIMLMCGIMPPTAGVVRWKGEAVTDPRAWTDLRRREIGIVFQDFNLFPTLSACENVEVAMFGTEPSAKERRRRAEEGLAAVGLSSRITHLPHELSGGERQRVAIARSIVNNPELLLADEPTGNLDSASGAAIMDLLFDLRGRQTVTLVIVTHDSRYASRCERRINIKDGSVHEERVAGDKESVT